MALTKGKITDVPPDGVMLSESEALKYQFRLLKSWKKESDIWAFKYGTAILGSLSAISGIYINSHYRRKLKLFSYGKISSYLPICVLPATLSFLFHAEFVVPDVVLQKSCAVCIELRASALQATLGCVLPSILAPLSALSLAMRYGTYDVPYITKEPMKVFKLWKAHTKPVGNILFAIFLGQALAGSAMTYLEAKSIQKCNETLMKLEYELEKAVHT